jgi:hypothetical protein
MGIASLHPSYALGGGAGLALLHRFQLFRLRQIVLGFLLQRDRAIQQVARMSEAISGYC